MEKETIIFQTNDSKKIEVVFEDGTVWLTQAQMAELFGVNRQAISKHLNKFFASGEFEESRVCSILERTAADGKTYLTKFYNLEMIVSVGNRVKSSNINQFKTWAEDVIKARTSSLMIPDNSIRNLIKTIRNQQVMLDYDLAVLYGVETKVLNQAVSRNIERFPEDFMFQLTWEECENLRSQIVTSSSRSQFVTLISRSQIATLKLKQGDNIKYLPYAFTEQGVAMLSGVLHSPTAIEANIRIMRAFVGMRHFINENAKLFQRMETIENNQIEMIQSQQRIEQRQFEMEHIQIEMQGHQQDSDQKIEELFQRLDEGRTNPKEGIFFDGQIFDAYVFVSNLIKKAQKEIILIDNYVDESVLNILSKRNGNVDVTIYTSKISNQFKLDLEKYNSQYQPITVRNFNKSHDRFLIIDDEIYHLGASLKDLGKKWFAFSTLNFSKEDIIGKLK
ncbi:MAG: ORF6N domain-containing protein [Bacteroidales bacterium]|nr:ORF6N domain-containing protein [Bacteroidales bacterium]